MAQLRYRRNRDSLQGKVSVSTAARENTSVICNALDLVLQVVVITGASSGLGEALAHNFYVAGCKVVLAARRREELERVRTDLLEIHSVSGDGRERIHTIRQWIRILLFAADSNASTRRAAIGLDRPEWYARTSRRNREDFRPHRHFDQ